MMYIYFIYILHGVTTFWDGERRSNLENLLSKKFHRPVTLQKCFVDNETLPDFPSAWEGGHADWIFQLWVN